MNKMRVLLTGSQGYIGTVLSSMLKQKLYSVVSYDTGFYKENLTGNFEENDETIEKDIRDFEIKDFQNVDVIIHLAALSNDPVGEFSPSLTQDINYNATKKIANLAKEAGVKRFIYSSSQSMYGIADLSKELDEDDSDKKPVTAYAKAKWDAELYLNTLNSSNFSVVCFRPSTVFGASPRLRTDVVFNNLVACAFTTGVIEIKSDGSPWRPIVHVRDVCSAFIAGIEAPDYLVAGQAFNIGIRGGNYTVKQIAEAAQRAVPNSKLIFTNEHTDPRTYKVSFDRILNDLKDYYKPEWDLTKGGYELVKFFEKIGFTEKQFKSRDTIRLKQLQYLTETNKINSELRKIK